MASRSVESIFNVKNNLEDVYPNYANIKTFDLEKKHLFYGRIDRNGNAIYIDDSNLEQAYTGGGNITEWAADFVVDAFDDMRAVMINAHSVGSIDKNSLYNGYIAVKKAWRQNGDLANSYFQHLNKIYREFTQEYLLENRRFENIKNFKDFVKEFLLFSSGVARYFPITMTGYLLSHHCPPFVSGLMLEIAEEKHGTQNNQSILKYATDKNFLFFVKEASKFGFMVDKNAPWRIVFNLASGTDTESDAPLNGGRKYMDRYGISFTNVFDSYYVQSHLQETNNLKKYFLALYTSFWTQYSTFETVKACYQNKVFSHLGVHPSIHIPDSAALGSVEMIRADREPPPTILGIKEDVDEYWLKIALKLRLIESGYEHNNNEFKSLNRKMIHHNREISQNAALNFINDLTKGLYASKFIRKGMYWHGDYAAYEEKQQQALDNASDPSRVDYALTGTKNIVR